MGAPTSIRVNDNLLARDLSVTMCSQRTVNIDGDDLLGKLGLWQDVGIDLVLVGVVDSAGEGAVGTSSFNSSYWKGSCRCDDRRQLGLEGCAKARVGRQVLEVLLGTIATVAFGYAGETGVLEARIGFIFGMGGWLRPCRSP